MERVGEKMADMTRKASLVNIRAMEKRVEIAEQKIHDVRWLAEKALQQSEDERRGEAKPQQTQDTEQQAEKPAVRQSEADQ